MLAVTSNARLISPVDLVPLVLGPLRNRGVVFIQPLPDCGWALFIRVLQRLLRRKAPPLQIFPDRPNWHGT